ncbi:MAG TPA: DsbA family oxidoreductase [Stellaceae bacterium]|nr:DsbA family oxidoreductase [Stellaceae bacterium]
MRVDIFADVVCPWCFIGKRRFERALAMRPDTAIEPQWHPFQLNPDMPREGVPADEFFAAKFGDPQAMNERRGMVAEIGASVGIDFAFNRIAREPNTFEAHRLIRFAARHGVADRVVEALFAAHFLAGRDVGDRATLAVIASEAGLDPGETRRFLDSESEADAIRAAEQEARRIGITAVPCFIFDRQYAVSGAQEPEFFLPIFDLVQRGAAATN